MVNTIYQMLKLNFFRISTYFDKEYVDIFLCDAIMNEKFEIELFGNGIKQN